MGQPSGAGADESRTCAEQGFTLVEVIVGIMLLTMITGALGTVMVTALGATGNAKERTNGSNDAQLIAGFFTRDGQAAGGINPLTGVADPTLGISTINDAGCAGPGSLVVRMKWVDRTPSSATAKVVVYSFDPSRRQVLRTTCVNAGTPSSSVLANHVVSSASPRSPLAWCDDNESAPCPLSPRKVSLRLTESNNPPTTPQPFTYTLSATMRTQAGTTPTGPSGPSGPSGPPFMPAPLLLFGGSGCPAGNATGLSISTAAVRVRGQAFINSGASDSTCPAMRLGTVSGYTAAGTSILSPGVCRSSGLLAGPCPTIVPYPIPIPDPYAGLPPPTVPSGNPSGCPGAHASPGTYTGTLVIGASACTLDSGVYILQRGISLTTGSVTSGPGGVLLYITGGTFSTALGALVNLSPMTTGPYAGLVVWQDKADTTSLLMGNLALFNLNGTVYAPTATLNFSNVSVSFKIGGIVAKSLILNLVGAMDIGP